MRTLAIGGTGNVGRQVVKRLLAVGEDVSIMTPDPAPRHPEGSRVIRGDLNEPDTVRAAVRDVDRMFLLLPQSPNETQQGLDAVDAARRARVSRLVYTSVRMPAFAPEVPHFATKMVIEKAVQASGIPFTILRPNNFFQNDIAFLDAILRYGVYPQPIGSAGLSRVDVRDIADAAAIALVEDGHEGEIYEVNGPELLSGGAVAEAYARRLGRGVRYAGDSLDAWSASVSHVLPPWLVSDLRVMYDKIQRHGMPSTPRDDQRLRQLLGRGPRLFDAFVTEVTESASLAGVAG